MKASLLTSAVFFAAFSLSLPVMAQEDGSTYVQGEMTDQVTNTDAYVDAESAAAGNPYGTGEGNAEWQGNTFDGTTSTGSYQDTETLQPGGTYAEPNSDPQQ